MARLGENSLNKALGLVFLLGFQWVKEILVWFCSPTDKRGIFFSFSHWCSCQCNWQKSHFACTLLYKQLMWLVYCAYPWRIGHLDPLTWWAERWGSLTRQVVVTTSEEVCSAQWGWTEEQKMKEHQGPGPICARRQTAARVTKSVTKEKSPVAVSALDQWAALPGLVSELKQGLCSLFHNFSVPQTVSLFLDSSLFF